MLVLVARSREMSGNIAYNWSGTKSSHPVPSSGEMLLGQATRLLTSEQMGKVAGR
jgi:hypothetical protein